MAATKQVEHQMQRCYLLFKYSDLRTSGLLEYSSSEIDNTDNMKFCRLNSNRFRYVCSWYEDIAQIFEFADRQRSARRLCHQILDRETSDKSHPCQGTLRYNAFHRSLLCGRFPGVFMVRWIAFDDDTAEAVVSRLRRGAAEIQHSVPVDAALRTDGSAVLVLPSPNPGKLLVARFSTRKRTVLRPPSPAVSRSAAIAPPAIKKSVESVKKPWWRRIVA